MSVIDALPPIPKDLATAAGKLFVVQNAVVKTNVQTQMGVLSKALIVEGSFEGSEDEYSHMFGLNKEQIAGSAGRVLTSLKVKHIDELNEKKLKEFVGKKFLIKNQNGKLYWYVP